MRIVVDAMGGDNAPESTVKGAIMAKKEFGVDIILVGDENKMKPFLDGETGIEIVHTDVLITMKDEATAVLKEKRNSSMGMALDILARGDADAFVTSGSTGATISGATLIAKRIKGVRRAALAPILPTKTGGALLIDCGANVECSEEFLAQFALMGSIYYEKACNKQKPRVTLVNNGAESTKGTPVLIKTYKMLEEMHEKKLINFIGNIEGRDIALGHGDVLVADGFTGNVLLKTYEGVGLYIAGEVKKIFTKNIFTKIAALMVKSGINDFKKSMDYKEIGGAPLIGISKPVIKAHGSCNAYAFRSAIKQAMEYKASGTIEEIEARIS